MKHSSDECQDSADPISEKIEAEEEKSTLLKTVEETLESLRRASSVLPHENNSELDDDENEMKLKTNPPEVKSSTPKQRASIIIPKMISDDIAMAYQASKMKQKEGRNDQNQDGNASEKIPIRYDLGQASLMGAVLGIGERDKSKDSNIKRVPSLQSRIGTLAGLGDITDEEADLRENNDAQLKNKSDKHFVKEKVKSHQSSKVSKDKVQDVPSTSHNHLQNVEDFKKSKKTKETGGLMRMLRNMKKKLFDDN